MANNCSTTYTLHCEDEKQLDAFEKNMEEALERKELENEGISSSWLGWLIIQSGAATLDDILNTQKYQCRGYISWWERTDFDEITIDVITAWIPMHDAILEMAAAFAPDAEIIYRAEELGCEIVQTNDPAGEEYLFFALGNSNLPSEVADLEYSYVYKAEMNKRLSKVLGKSGATDDLVEEFNEKYGENAWIYTVSFVELPDHVNA